MAGLMNHQRGGCLVDLRWETSLEGSHGTDSKREVEEELYK